MIDIARMRADELVINMMAGPEISIPNC